MSDLLLFIIGCAVSFLFLGGMLIHMVAGQKIADAEDLDADPGRGKGEDRANE